MWDSYESSVYSFFSYSLHPRMIIIVCTGKRLWPTIIQIYISLLYETSINRFVLKVPLRWYWFFRKWQHIGREISGQYIWLSPGQNTLSIPEWREYCLRFWFTKDCAILSRVIALLTWASLPLDVSILSGIFWFALPLPVAQSPSFIRCATITLVSCSSTLFTAQPKLFSTTRELVPGWVHLGYLWRILLLYFFCSWGLPRNILQ